VVLGLVQACLAKKGTNTFSLTLPLGVSRWTSVVNLPLSKCPLRDTETGSRARPEVDRSVPHATNLLDFDYDDAEL